MKLLQAESTYHSIRKEPLGRSYVRGHAMPEATKRPGFASGKGSERANMNGKELIYSPSEPVTEAEKLQYIKSHGSFEPGEQRTRGPSQSRRPWPVAPGAPRRWRRR